MAILWVLLLVAEVPTAFFNWASLEEYYDGIYSRHEVSAANATSYARCFFDMKIANSRFKEANRCLTTCHIYLGCQTICRDHGFSSLKSTSAFQNMIITFLLLILTGFTRVVKIMEALSTWAQYRLRARLSRFWRRRILLADSVFLRSTRNWTPIRISMWKYFVVNQGLAMLLLSRLYADIYTSTLSEVSECLFSSSSCDRVKVTFVPRH